MNRTAAPQVTRRYVAVTVVLLAVLGSGYWFGVRPQLQGAKEAQSALTSAQKVLGVVQSEADQLELNQPSTPGGSLPTGAKYLADLRTALRAAQQTLPANADAVEQDLPRLIAAQGLTLTSQNRAADVEVSGQISYAPFTLSVTGTRAAVSAFVQVVENYPSVLSLTGVTLTGEAAKHGTTPGEVTLSAQLRVWHSALPSPAELARGVKIPPAAAPRSSAKPAAGTAPGSP